MIQWVLRGRLGRESHSPAYPSLPSSTNSRAWPIAFAIRGPALQMGGHLVFIALRKTLCFRLDSESCWHSFVGASNARSARNTPRGRTLLAPSLVPSGIKSSSHAAQRPNTNQCSTIENKSICTLMAQTDRTSLFEPNAFEDPFPCYQAAKPGCEVR